VITAIVVAAVWHRWILVVPTGGLAVLGYYLASVVEGHAFVFNHLVQEKSGLSQLLLDALVLFVDEGFSLSATSWSMSSQCSSSSRGSGCSSQYSWTVPAS
jgi:hypothetical protein